MPTKKSKRQFSLKKRKQPAHFRNRRNKKQLLNSEEIQGNEYENSVIDAPTHTLVNCSNFDGSPKPLDDDKSESPVGTQDVLETAVSEATNLFNLASKYMSENQLKWLEDLAENTSDTPEEHLPNYNNWLSHAAHLNSLGNNKRSAAKWKLIFCCMQKTRQRTITKEISADEIHEQPPLQPIAAVYLRSPGPLMQHSRIPNKPIVVSTMTNTAKNEEIERLKKELRTRDNLLESCKMQMRSMQNLNQRLIAMVAQQCKCTNSLNKD